jgi:hypothetical protein
LPIKIEPVSANPFAKILLAAILPAQAILPLIPKLEEEKQMSEATSTLLSNGGKLTRDQLALVTTPPATATHRPVPHREVIQALVETLGFRIAVVKDEYAVSKDGMKMFGVLDLDTGMHG